MPVFALPSSLPIAAYETMAAEVIDEKTRNRFKDITRKVYVDQAKWYLVRSICSLLSIASQNGFWAHGAEKEAEEVWLTTLKFIEQDPKKKKGMIILLSLAQSAAGNELNEVEAHHYLQKSGQTMTARTSTALSLAID